MEIVPALRRISTQSLYCLESFGRSAGSCGALHAVYSRALASETQFYLCAEDEGAVAGFCSLTLKNNLWQAGNLAHIDELVVEERQRRKGIGSALLDAAVKMAAGRGCASIELDSAFHRGDAHRFYESQGFENSGLSLFQSLRSELSLGTSFPIRAKIE